MILIKCSSASRDENTNIYILKWSDWRVPLKFKYPGGVLKGWANSLKENWQPLLSTGLQLVYIACTIFTGNFSIRAFKICTWSPEHVSIFSQHNCLCCSIISYTNMPQHINTYALEGLVQACIQFPALCDQRCKKIQTTFSALSNKI